MKWILLLLLAACTSTPDLPDPPGEPVVLRASDRFGEKPGWGPLSFVDHLEVKGMKNEIIGIVLKLDQDKCVDLNSDEQRQFFSMPPIQLSNKSYENSYIGTHYDDLLTIPSGEYCADNGEEYLWLDYKIEKEEIFRVGGLELSVKPWDLVMSDEKAMPLYVELSTYYALQGHYGDSNQSSFPWGKQWAVGENYLKVLKEHRISPYKHYVHPHHSHFTEEVLDKGDQDPNTKVMMYVFGHQNETMQPGYLQSTEQYVKTMGLESRAITYLRDEPHSIINQVAQEATLVRQYAPSLEIMVTAPAYPQLDGLVDIYVPVLEWFDDGQHLTFDRFKELGVDYWLYTGCMGAGCYTIAHGDGSGCADLILDRPSVYARSFFFIPFAEKYAAHLAKGLLYYHAVEGFRAHPTTWDDMFHLFSNNGDGQLFGIPRQAERPDEPIPTIRLKLLRRGSYDANYLKLALDNDPVWFKNEIKQLVTDPRNWDKDYSKYTKLIEKIGAKYGGAQ